MVHLGDFNIVFESTHRISGSQVAYIEVQDGIECINCSWVLDRGQQGTSILGLKRVKALGRHKTMIQYTNPYISDHSPLLVKARKTAGEVVGPLNFLINWLTIVTSSIW